ncbi:MAG: GntR family transcriptional regulator [Pseudomonadota bacterium]
MLDRNSPFDTTVRFESEKLADFAYARLRDAFVRCDIAPGAVVSEAAMARRLGLGKAPIRAALARLAADGWVHPAPRRGYLVAPITLGSIQDVFEMRRALEPLLAKASPSAAEAAEISRQQSMADALRNTASKSAQTSTLQIAREIRSLLLAATNNRLLQATLPHLWDLSDRLEHYLEHCGRKVPDADYWAEVSALALNSHSATGAIDQAIAHQYVEMEREFLALGRDLPLMASGHKATAAPPSNPTPMSTDADRPFRAASPVPQDPSKN